MSERFPVFEFGQHFFGRRSRRFQHGGNFGKCLPRPDASAPDVNNSPGGGRIVNRYIQGAPHSSIGWDISQKFAERVHFTRGFLEPFWVLSPPFSLKDHWRELLSRFQRVPDSLSGSGMLKMS